MVRITSKVVNTDRAAQELYDQAVDHLDDILVLAAAYAQCPHNTSLLEALLVVELNAASLLPACFDLRWQWTTRPYRQWAASNPPPPARITILALYHMRYLPGTQALDNIIWVPLGLAIKDTMQRLEISDPTLPSPRSTFMIALAGWSVRQMPGAARPSSYSVLELEELTHPPSRVYQTLDPRSASDPTRLLAVQALCPAKPSCALVHWPLITRGALLSPESYPVATGHISHDRAVMLTPPAVLPRQIPLAGLAVPTAAALDTCAAREVVSTRRGRGSPDCMVSVTLTLPCSQLLDDTPPLTM